MDREDAGGGQGDEKTCHEVVNGIVTRIRVLCSDAGSGWDGVDGLGGKFLREEVSANEETGRRRRTTELTLRVSVFVLEGHYQSC